jgi:prepilin-type N-terminal cleavage/methylation domain-containing protein
MHLRSWRCKTLIKARGFSLVELLVVLAIAGFLAAIAIPQMMSHRARAVDSEMKADLRNAALAMEAYFAQNRTYPTSVAGIQAVGFTQTVGVTLSIDLTSPSSFRITAAKPSGTQPSFTFDSTTGNVN